MFLTVITSIIVIVIGFILISGLTKKTYACILGTIGGVVIAIVLSVMFSASSQISGGVSEEAYLLSSDLSLQINFADLFVSGIIIGAIGVVMDVSMSITSFIFELYEHSSKLPFTRMVASGLKVGKDVMATMINTLILACVGSSLPLIFFFANNSTSMTYVLSSEPVAGEIIRSLCGSIGLIATIPLTSLIASHMVLKERFESNQARPRYQNRYR